MDGAQGSSRIQKRYFYPSIPYFSWRLSVHRMQWHYSRKLKLRMKKKGKTVMGRNYDKLSPLSLHGGHFVVQSSVSLFAIPWTVTRQASLFLTVSQRLLKLMAIESVMTTSASVAPFLLLSSISPSIRVFSKELTLCIRWPKYWSFSFRISSSSEYSGVISFRIDWLDLLVVQGTLKNLKNQQHSSKAPEFFSAQPSLRSGTPTSIHDYWKNHSFD